MSALSKIFTILSIVCYLATSSVASAHAFPMKGNIGSSDPTTEIAATDKVAGASDEVQSQELTSMMACHQSSNADTVKAFGFCKIFCSAIGHAFLSTEVAVIASKFHPPSPHTEINSLTTRQLTVEHQPPK